MMDKAAPYYWEPHRHYHDFQHINGMLLYGMKHYELSYSQALAIILHDVVYVPGYSDNELASAKMVRPFAKDFDFLSETDIVMATAIIKLTRFHMSNLTEARLVIDLDLLGFAPSSPLYRENTRDLIRKEFSYVSDEVFNEGRVLALEKFVLRRPFFYCPKLEELYGEEARRYISSEMTSIELQNS
jgi:predicted metal-dependent HD superfamily phosphohydrolase